MVAKVRKKKNPTSIVDDRLTKGLSVAETCRVIVYREDTDVPLHFVYMRLWKKEELVELTDCSTRQYKATAVYQVMILFN